MVPAGCKYKCDPVGFQILKSLCLDNKRSEILQKLELSLDILGGTVERISNTAEVLGAVHQVHYGSGSVKNKCHCYIGTSTGSRSFLFISCFV